MTSPWLDCEDLSLSYRSKKGVFSKSSPCLGIFTDHPANIRRRLGRPTTPFVPAPVNTINIEPSFYSDVGDFSGCSLSSSGNSFPDSGSPPDRFNSFS
jgi:hypothetical protein